MSKENLVIENNFTPVKYDPQYILQVNELKKYFPIKGGMFSHTVGYVKAVDGVTFNLKRGTTMGLVGESGCGKTTTGRTILRLSGEKKGGQVFVHIIDKLKVTFPTNSTRKYRVGLTERKAENIHEINYLANVVFRKVGAGRERKRE